MQPPRLLYIDDSPAPYRLGVFRRIAERWPGSFHVAFCAGREHGREFDLDFRGLETEVLAGYQWRPPGQINPHAFKWNPGVAAMLTRLAPQVVVLAGYAQPTMLRAARWCLMRSVPYAVTCETSANSTVTSGVRWVVRRRAVGWMIRNMAFGLPAGRAAAAYLRRLGDVDVPMKLFPNTPDTSLFQEALAEVTTAGRDGQLRAHYGLVENGPVFTFVGRLIAAKRPCDAIRAFRSLPSDVSASLLVVGDGPELRRARADASDDPRIVFVGWIGGRRELAHILAMSSALVLPSAHEPWGAVVNEAMAAKACPIVTDRVGAAVELIEHGRHGCVVPVDDISALRDAMLALVRDPERFRRMGEAAQARALRYGAHFAAENLVRGALDATTRRTSETT